MPSVMLHLEVEDSDPGMTRTVVLSSQATLAELHEVICTAFDFTGAQPHHFRSAHPAAGTSWTAADEAVTILPNLLVDPYGSALYHYGNEESWTVRLRSVGFPAERMLVPKLIDATGPDVIEGCGGPAAMTAMRTAAVRAIATLDVDLEAADLIADHLPGLHPHQVAQRLTYTDPAGIAGRVCFAILPGYQDGLGPVGATHGDGTATDALANPADWPDAVLGPDGEVGDETSGSDLREQLPGGEGDAHLLGEETIREIRDALKAFPNITFAPGVTLPEDEDTAADPWPQSEPLSQTDAVAVTESIRWFLGFIGAGRPLTQAGYLKPVDVETVVARIEAEKYNIGKLNREVETPAVLVFREALVHLRLLRVVKKQLRVTRLGQQLAAEPGELAHYLAQQLPLLYDASEHPAMAKIFADWWRGNPRGSTYPECYGDNVQMLLAMNVLDRNLHFRTDHRSAEPLTPAGHNFLALVLATPRA